MYEQVSLAIIVAFVVLVIVFILGLMYSPLWTLLFGLGLFLLFKFAK